MAFCTNCGSELKPEMKFCDNCGTPVAAAAEQEMFVETGEETKQPPQQGVYTPPAPQQGSYTSPAPQQGSYTPPAPQQGSYTPPAPQQGSYTPPAPQQGGYTPPASQQGGYTPPPPPPPRHDQASYNPPVPSAGGPPPVAPKQASTVNKKLFIFGGIALVVILAVVLIFTLGRGKDKNGLQGPPGLAVGDNVQDIWNGTWYGYFWVTDAFGEWEGYEDTLSDAFMVIEVDGKGKGTMSIYLDDLEGLTVVSDINAGKEYFEVTEGIFWDMDLDPDNWWVGFDPMSAGRHVIISDTYIDPELTGADGFEYIFSFRPHGDKWDEEIDDGGILPPGYDDYIAELGPEGSGGKVSPVFTGAELRVIYDSLPVSADLTYEEVRDQYFDGVEGVLDFEKEKSARYEWRAVDNDNHYLAVVFEDRKGDGIKRLVGSSGSMP